MTPFEAMALGQARGSIAHLSVDAYRALKVWMRLHEIANPHLAGSTRATRKTAMLALLSAKPQRAEDLGAMLGVDRSTIYRDMAALRRQGLPIEASKGLNGGYTMADVT